MRIYLAARYSRREEMQLHAADLLTLGHEVVSRWITGCHEIPGRSEALGARNTYTIEERRHFATEDMDDLRYASIMVAFTEPENATFNRGGRHVEFGMALAWGLQCLVVGPRENVFHCLPKIHAFEGWGEALEFLRSSVP